MLYPLKMGPIPLFSPAGGRAFADVLEMDVPRDRPIAQVVALAAQGQAQSVVQNGPLAGRTLAQLMELGAELVGEEVFAKTGARFPLLLKWVDAGEKQSAHLHPDDAVARALQLDEMGGAQAWYVVRAEPGAGTYCGALPGLTGQSFADAIGRGDPYNGVMKLSPTRTGDTYFLPTGRPHALGEGNLAFEVGQNSVATLVWEPQDSPVERERAVEHARYEDGPQEQTQPITLTEDNDERAFCCACRHFVLERLRVLGATRFHDAQARFNAFTLVAGAATFEGGGQSAFAKRGDTLLIPAGVAVAIVPNSLTNAGVVEMLRCYVPDLERDVVSFLRQSGVADRDIAGLGSYGSGNDLLPLLGLPQDFFNVTALERHDAALLHRDSRDETS